jgi:prepilin-type N-terminal cleavage/methylation domain-containing protein
MAIPTNLRFGIWDWGFNGPSNLNPQSPIPNRRGFSLIEALIALSITSLAGAVLLLSVQSSLDTTIDAVDQTIADGLAQQTLDEILTKRYVGPAESPTATTLGPSTSELLSGGTTYFDDADDYNGYTAIPIKGWYGELFGTGDDGGNLRLANFRVRSEFFQNWRVRVSVYYVSPDDHTLQSATPTYFRAIEVNVEQVKPSGNVVPLATRKRVITYISPPSS